MADLIDILHEDKIIKIISYGEVTMNDLLSSFQIIKYYHGIEDYNKILIDVSNLKEYIDPDQFMSAIPITLSEVYIAFIYSNSKILKTLKIIEQNQDFGTFEFFSDEDNAFNWLDLKPNTALAVCNVA